MRRDYFTLAVRNVPATDDGEIPTLVVTYDGPTDQLADRLTDAEGAPIDADEVDVTCRLQVDHESGSSCAVSLTHRVTGEYLVEVNGDAADLHALVEAARDVDEEPSYRLRIERPAEDPIVYDMRTLLVYDESGDLKRGDSLIPSGVEL